MRPPGPIVADGTADATVGAGPLAKGRPGPSRILGDIVNRNPSAPKTSGNPTTPERF